MELSLLGVAVLGVEVVMVSRVLVVSSELLKVVMSDMLISLDELVMAVSGLVIKMVVVTASNMPFSGVGVVSFNASVALNVVVS